MVTNRRLEEKILIEANKALVAYNAKKLDIDAFETYPYISLKVKHCLYEIPDKGAVDLQSYYKKVFKKRWSNLYRLDAVLIGFDEHVIGIIDQLRDSLPKVIENLGIDHLGEIVNR